MYSALHYWTASLSAAGCGWNEMLGLPTWDLPQKTMCSLIEGHSKIKVWGTWAKTEVSSTSSVWHRSSSFIQNSYVARWWDATHVAISASKCVLATKTKHLNILQGVVLDPDFLDLLSKSFGKSHPTIQTGPKLCWNDCPWLVLLYRPEGSLKYVYEEIDSGLWKAVFGESPEFLTF